ncbi:MAG: DNA polymerase I [Bacteroidales bacterium]|nr:DNA polymerase I [Bacteroidales bacterium]
MDKLFLIDGHALVFKMYYAFLRRPMVNSKGADMSILFGFTKYLLELIEREQPTHLAVAFDPPGGTFRNELYPDYKGTRPPTPQLVIDALEPLTELVKAMNIPVLMVKGFEADDVIGSMALRSAREGMDVYMVTPDKDYGQLIAEHVFQYKPGKAGGDDEIVDRAAICEKWGILDPIQIIDMLAICGDSADNVPGVKGVGEVGAGKLISKYGSIENIYAHLSELSPRQQAQFEEARSYIGLSKELVTIKTDIPLETTAEDMRLDMNFSPAIADLFEKYEFNSLKRFIAHVGPSAASKERKEFIVNEVSPAEIIKAIRQAGACGLVTEAYGEGIFSPVRRLFVGCGDKACVVPGDRLESVRAVLEDDSTDKFGYDLKLQANLLAHAGIGLKGKWNDIELMHYLLNPEKSHAVELLARTYLDIELEETPAQAGTGSLFDEVPEEEGSSRTREAAALVPLGRKIREELADRQRLYDEMEEPLAKVLAKMERAGVKVDLHQLDIFAQGLRKEMEERQAHIREMVGEPDLNISSPKQVGDILFEKLRLDPKAKKSARGQYPTDEATLLAIADKHPVVDEILEFRAVKKLLSTYIEPFPSYVSPVDGRVHTTFNQALTATGRLSSSNPNLQNIPIRTERGKEIRKAFIPGTPEGVIVSADYSQIELRIMAHLSCDEHLVKSFRDGVDVHAATAAKIYGIPLSEVTREQRGRAKTANFGIMYGISSFGLAQRLNLGRKEAKELIDGYFATFPAIKSFIADSIDFAKENGYVETLLGRRRYLPDITSKNFTVRSLAERNAVNAPIQGTSADIIKLAMIGVDKRITEAGLKSRMVLQIHDELVFDAVPEEVETLEKIVVDVMENVIKLSVPLTVECSSGKNWLEAH